jgi:ABC-type Fe3+ transport system substrate-binding protein
MTNAQWRKEQLGGCSMAAEDCKGSADYAAYAFKQGHEEEARRYVRNLRENLSRLDGEIAMLDRANKRVEALGAEAEFRIAAPI